MDVWHVVTGSIALCGLVQLSPNLPNPPPTSAIAAVAPIAKTPDPVVFVVVDGVRWQEIFRGTDPALSPPTIPKQTAEQLTPKLHAIMRDRGAAIGAPGRSRIAASGPRFVSLPSYREIFSGESSLDCLDNACPPIERTTIVDDVRSKGRSAAVFSSWPTISHAAAKNAQGALVSTGLQPSDDGLESWPGEPGFRPDRYTATVALAHLEKARPDFMFLGLGEPDEYAHQGNYAAYVSSLQAMDRTIGELEQTLVRMGERGARTNVFVTADHGRAKNFRDHGGAYPESAAVWLVAFGPAIQARGSLVTTTPHRLADLAPTARLLLEVPRTSPEPMGAGAPLRELFGDEI